MADQPDAEVAALPLLENLVWGVARGVGIACLPLALGLLQGGEGTA
jgi:hypothetical protein